MKSKDTLLKEAKAFINQYYQESGKDGSDRRWKEVQQQIAIDGTYVHTFDELNYGAKVAWRNSNRCIGRLFWKTLKVLDRRKTKDEKAFFNALHGHIKTADYGEKVRNTITIFPPLRNDSKGPVFKIKNYTLIMYAGYQINGELIGDPAHLDFTAHCQSLGWEGKGTAFDLLPVVYSINNGPDKYYQLPPELITEVPISHPDHEWFRELGLRWYKLPIISSMKLDIGGIVYPAAPFNGWYMLDEVATRNFGDQKRYNVLPLIAEYLALDKTSPFWQERALLVLNEAVYHSYNQAGATIVDHHTAVAQFMQFTEQEHLDGREVTGDWSWLIPPTASSTTEVFHLEMDNTVKLPNYVS